MIWITLAAVWLTLASWWSTAKIADKSWKAGIDYGVKHYDVLKVSHPVDSTDSQANTKPSAN